MRRRSSAPRALLLDGQLGGRHDLEAAVRDRLAAQDGDAVGARRKARLGPLDGGELLAEVVRETAVELVLVQV